MTDNTAYSFLTSLITACGIQSFFSLFVSCIPTNVFIHMKTKIVVYITSVHQPSNQQFFWDFLIFSNPRRADCRIASFCLWRQVLLSWSGRFDFICTLCRRWTRIFFRHCWPSTFYSIETASFFFWQVRFHLYALSLFRLAMPILLDNSSGVCRRVYYHNLDAKRTIQTNC